MALNCGIVGLAGSGKTTLFNALQRGPAGANQVQGRTNLGRIEVPDPRLDAIAALTKPPKVVRTTVEIVDIPGLTKGSSQVKGGNQFLSDIRQCDAIIHVLRCFDDDTVPHMEGSVDPLRDKEIIDLELIFKDMEAVEKKLDKYKKASKAGEKDAIHGAQILTALMEHLENGKRAATFNIQEQDKKYLDGCFLLTVKPVLYVCNVDDNSVVSGNEYTRSVENILEEETATMLIIAAQAEAEISELDDPYERREFLNDIGIDEPGVNKLVRKAYQLLNLQTFYTIGPKETRAWTIRKGMTAPQAAGVIHSDLERGFIRAEVIKYNNFIELGSEQACKNAGKCYIEGKNYVVKEGDMMYVRFNV